VRVLVSGYAHAAEVASDFLAAAGLTATDIDLVIANQYPRGFGIQVARQLGFVTAGAGLTIGLALYQA